MGYVMIYGRSTRYREATTKLRQTADVKAKGMAKLILARDEERKKKESEEPDSQ